MSMSSDWSPTLLPPFLSAILPPMANAKSSVRRADPPKNSTVDKARSSNARAEPLPTSTSKSPSGVSFGALLPQEADSTLTFEVLPARANADENDVFLRCLLVPIATGDQKALADFYDASVGRVYSIALRIVRRPEMAEEVVSDVYMQVWRDATRYDTSRGRVLAWLLVITRSRALDLLRRQDEAFSHPEPQDLIAEPEDNGKNPQDLLSATQSNALLGEALRALSPMQRHLISLAFFKGLSHSEIVEHAGIPLGSVKTHIRRALTVLREALGGEFDMQQPSNSGNGSKTALKVQD